MKSLLYLSGSTAAQLAKSIDINRRLSEVRNKERKHNTTLDKHNLLESIESAFGRLLVIGSVFHLVQQAHSDFLQGLRSDHVVKIVESSGGGGAHLRKRVHEGFAHRGHERVGEGQDVVSARRGHDLGETDAHTLSLLGALRVQAAFEDRDDVREHAFAKFLHDVH